MGTRSYTVLSSDGGTFSGFMSLNTAKAWAQKHIPKREEFRIMERPALMTEIDAWARGDTPPLRTKYSDVNHY